jgi:hypothetical protein
MPNNKNILEKFTDYCNSVLNTCNKKNYYLICMLIVIIIMILVIKTFNCN